MKGVSDESDESGEYNGKDEWYDEKDRGVSNKCNKVVEYISNRVRVLEGRLKRGWLKRGWLKRDKWRGISEEKWVRKKEDWEIGREV
jgi:hypothetical protein